MVIKSMDFLTNFAQTGLGKVLLSGAVVNFIIVIICGFIGSLFKKGIPEKIKTALMNGMALCVIYIGISGTLEENVNILVCIISMAFGAVIGELLDLDRLVNKIGQKLENKLGNNDTKIAQGFVTATLLFCVGAMTVVGSIESGISGDNSTLYSKAVIDGVSAIALASTFGIGVMLSAFSVLIIQGGITLLAVFIAPVLNETALVQMSVIGSLLIIALGLNMLGITKIKVMNLLPAIFLPLLFYCFI